MEEKVQRLRTYMLDNIDLISVCFDAEELDYADIIMLLQYDFDLANINKEFGALQQTADRDKTELPEEKETYLANFLTNFITFIKDEERDGNCLPMVYAEACNVANGIIKSLPAFQKEKTKSLNLKEYAS